ncbi:hypothetical protein IV102_37410 [bacterium]|nr:hypothetical protein [bacterium]
MRRRWLELVLVIVAVAFFSILSRRPTTPSTQVTPLTGTPQPIARSQTPQANDPRQQYAACAHNLESMMQDLQKTGGETGEVSMLTLNMLSMKYPCPATGQPSISATGGVSTPTGVSLTDLTLFCRGKQHMAAGVPENYPDFHSVRGLNRGLAPNFVARD